MKLRSVVVVCALGLLCGVSNAAVMTWVNLNAPNGDISTAGTGPNNTYSSSAFDAGYLYQNWQVSAANGGYWNRGTYGQTDGGIYLYSTNSSSRSIRGRAVHDAWGGVKIEAAIYKLSFWSYNSTGYTDDRNTYYGFLHDGSSMNDFSSNLAATSDKLKFNTTSWTKFTLYWDNTGSATPQAVIDDWTAEIGTKPAIRTSAAAYLGNDLRFGLTVGGWTALGKPQFDNFVVEKWSVVPEPVTMGVLAMGGLGLLLKRRKA